jgi:O-antigen/teichoic acid export membrane protein
VTAAQQLEPREIQARALSGISWSTLSSVATLPLSIAVSVLLAHRLGVNGFAHFALLAFLVPLATQVVDFGFATGSTRRLSRAYAAGDLDATRELLGKSLGFSLLKLPIVLAVVLTLARPGLGAAAALGAYFVVTYLGSGLNLALNGENRISVQAKLAFLQALGSGGAAIGAALLGASPVGVYAASLLGGAVSAPGWYIAANPALRRAALRPRLPRRLGAGFWRYGAVTATSSVVSLLVFSRSEIVVLALLGTKHDVAVFALAYGLAQRLTTPVDTLLGPLIPALAALEAVDKERLRAGFERALRIAATGVAFLAAATVVGTVYAAPVLFGSKYQGVGLAFAALAGISLLQSAAHPYTALVYAIGRPGVALRALSVALVLDAGLCVALIPWLGIWGAVVANAVGALAAIALAARAALGRGSVRRAGVPVARLALVGGGAAACAIAAGAAAARIHPALGALAAYAAGAIAFAIGVRLVGGLLPGADTAVLVRALPARLRRPAAALVT